MNTGTQEVRNAAEVLLHPPSSAHNVESPITDSSLSHSVNTVPSISAEYVVSSDFIAGQRVQGRMSNIRRFFCLFVTFDLAFNGLMWLICIVINGQDMNVAINKQIFHYNIHTSLFDVVLLSICRFIFLLLFYGCFYLNHWLIIALSTTSTCLFLIYKVFVYDWVDAQQPVFQVMLILASFIISWSETWFFDFRVLPQELYASHFNLGVPNVRTPLIQNYVQGLPSMYTDSVANFYSPLCSPEGSLHIIDYDNRCYLPVKFSREKEEELKAKGATSLQQSWNLIQSLGWKLEKSQESDSVYSLVDPKIGKIYKLSVSLDVSAKYLLDELFYKVDQMSQWNTALVESHKIQTIDEYTDISYQISAGAVGVISSRDFVSVRHWAKVEEYYIIAYTSTEHPSVPKNDKYIRGANRIGCWAMKPLLEDSNKCQFIWILNTDLKGWIPTYVLDSALAGMMFNYTKDLRTYILELKRLDGLSISNQ